MTDHVQAVLFDVDGTLVDSNYLHVVTWWEEFAQAGHDVPVARIHRAIGMGSEELLDALLPTDRDRDAESSISAAEAAMYSVYWSRLRPLPGAAALLRACRKLGLRVILASSANPRQLTSCVEPWTPTTPPPPATSAAASPRPTWSKSLSNARGRLLVRLSSSATPSGMRKPASGPVSHASAYLPAARASPSSATRERAGFMLPLLAFWTPFPAAC